MCSGLVGAGTTVGSKGVGSGPLGPGSLVQKALSAPDVLWPCSWPHSLWQEPSGPWGKLQAKWPTGSRSLKAGTVPVVPGSLWPKVLLSTHGDGEGSSSGNAHSDPFQTVALTLFLNLRNSSSVT